jgi:hypothetical protein
MRRTIFYTQPLLFESGALISASGISDADYNNITSNNIVFTGASFGHPQTGIGLYCLMTTKRSLAMAG